MTVSFLTCLPASPKLYDSSAAVTVFTSWLLRLMMYLVVRHITAATRVTEARHLVLKKTA
jgi:hypothetical protein